MHRHFDPKVRFYPALLPTYELPIQPTDLLPKVPSRAAAF
jgi:hypothetical protein